ncbi:MAG: UvrD-helicase domain-containing protein, partial [Proteobacteria bacterium]|nr:UvrD-helicase domain-containing protein [Pseudomonadota bacterium]
ALALDFDVSMTRARQLVRAIARSRRHPEDADAQIADARASYRRALTRNNLIERDELVGHAARALAADADLAASCRAWFDHIAIDDIHEIDDAHARLLAALIGTHGNVCAAGIATGVADAVFDARLARFEREHRGCACVRLGGRYRADGAIALLAARLLAPPAAERAGGARGALPDCVTIHAAKSDFAEAEFVAATIEQMIGGQNFLVHARGGAAQPPRMLSLADFAILYRSAEQADILTEALARARIPFHTLSCRPLDEDAAVLALLARLDAAVPDVNRPLADALRAATEALILDGVFAPVDVAPAYRQLSALIGAGAESLAALDDAVAMADAADFFDAHAARVVLSTLGAADGLEFAVVFIVGVEDGVLPLYVDTPDARALEDDRLRLYRGMARAGERLVLSHARKRLWRGRMRALGASPFLRELGYEPAPGADAPARALPGPQLRLI